MLSENLLERAHFCCKSPKLNKVVNKVSNTRCTGINILTDPTGPVRTCPQSAFHLTKLSSVRFAYIDCSMKFSYYPFLNPHVRNHNYILSVAEIVGVALITSSIFLAKSGAILPFRIHSLNLQKTLFMCIIFAA